MGDDDIDWKDGRSRRIGLLEHYGEQFYNRFTNPEKSTLHKCQKDALENVMEWFSNKRTDHLTALVVMPTGTGKTGIICCLPYTVGYLAKCTTSNIDATKSVLVIAPGLVILEQLRKDLDGCNFLRERRLLSQKDLKDRAGYQVYTVHSTLDVTKLEERVCHGHYDVVLSNSQKWRKVKGTPNYEDLPESLFSMVIVDEAHHLPASQWQEIVDQFSGFAKIVFLTATPDRADGKIIIQNFKKCAYKLSRIEAIERKLIREVKINILPVASEDPTELVVAEVKKRMKEKNDRHPLPGNKRHASIIITRDISDAERVQEICTSNGFNDASVTVVHHKIFNKKEKKDRIIEEIKSGKFKVVIIVKMLLEGFDYPPFSIAGIVTKIKSPVKFAQFIGRIQRLVRQPVVEDGIIGDIITHESFKQNDLFQKYIDPRVNTEKENEELDSDFEDDDKGI